MWHYRARKRIIENRLLKTKEVLWDVVEYFSPNTCKTIREKVEKPSRKPRGGWTADSIAPVGDTKEDLIWVLKHMLKDVQTRKVLFDKED